MVTTQIKSGTTFKAAGTANADIFMGFSYTDACGTTKELTPSGWIINGGAGIDIINTGITSSLTLPTTITNIENINVRHTGITTATINLSNLVGLTTVGSDASTQQLTIKGISNALTTVNYKNIDSKALIVTIDASALTSATDSLTINIIDISNTYSTAYLIVQPSALATNGYETITLHSTTSITNKNEIQSISDGTGTSFVTLNITGDKTLRINDALPSEVLTINASSMTAGGFILGTPSPAILVTGGAGDDIFLSSATISTSSFNGGDGTDVFGTTSALATVVTSPLANTIMTNFETLRITDVLAATLYASYFGDTINKVQLSNGSNGQTISLNNNSIIELEGTALSGTLTLTAGDITANDMVSVTVTANTGNKLNNQDIVAGEFNNLSIINFSDTTQTLKDITVNNKLIFSGSAGFTLTTAPVAYSLDASNLSASASLVMSLALAPSTARGVSLMGGEGDDTLIGGGLDDIITTNGGADIITGGAGNDIVNHFVSATQTLTLTTVERLNLTAGGVYTLTIADSGNSLTTLKIHDSSYALTLSGPLGNSLTTVDASNLTSGGKFVMSTFSTPGAPMTIKGGSGGDTLYGGNDDDIILGGNGADIMDGGSGTNIYKWTAITKALLATECGTNAGATSSYAAGSVGDTVVFTSATDKLHFAAELITNAAGTENDNLLEIAKSGIVTNTARFVQITDTNAADAVDTFAGAISVLSALDTSAVAISDSFIAAMDNDINTYLYYIKQVSIADTIAAQDVTFIGVLPGITDVANGDFVTF